MVKNILMFTVSLLIGMIVVVAGYSYAAPRYSAVIKPFFPKTSFSIENAPKNTLTGEVASISGSVAWVSRSSDLAKPISQPTKIQQGEEVDALGNGRATITFDNIATIKLSTDTQESFIQTLPVNFVVEQKQGSAIFERTGNIPVSVRALDLLINIESGKSAITVDPDSSSISVSVVSGSATAAYNDTNNLTNIVSLNAGEKYTFDNNTKTGRVK